MIRSLDARLSRFRSPGRAAGFGMILAGMCGAAQPVRAENPGNPAEAVFPDAPAPLLGADRMEMEATPQARADLSLTELAEPLIRRLKQKGLAVPEGSDAARQAVEALLRSRDPGARIGTAGLMEELEADRAGRTRGVGIEIGPTDPDVAIRRVHPGSPAEEAGFLPGDLLESLNGRFVAGRKWEDIQAALLEPDGESVRVSVLRPGEHRVRKADLVPRLLAPEPVLLAERWPRGLGYIRMGSLRTGAVEALAEIRREWEGRPLFGAILDLRGVGGDSWEQAARLARLLGVQALPKWEPPDGHGDASAPVPTSGERLFPCPVFLLVDGRTRGAAEWLAVAVQSGSPSLLIGSRTAGDPLLRQAVELGPADWAWIKTRRLRFSGPREREPDDAVIPDLPAARIPAASVQRDWEEERKNGRDRRGALESEEQDRLLSERLAGDGVLRRAADSLLAWRALAGMDRGLGPEALDAAPPDSGDASPEEPDADPPL